MGTRPPDLSTQQKLAVGFAGEWLGYQWLAQQYGPDFTQGCWVSKYREQLFPGGGDGLGWDFEVPVRHAKHYYEVNTTLSDGGKIELGETQVIAAQERPEQAMAAPRDHQTAQREPPHPHAEEPVRSTSRGRYSFVGQGLRLRYAID